MVAPDPDENGPPGKSIGVRDVTESKALEFRLIQSEKLAMTGQMSAEIGYKLRNYLTVLIEHIDLLGINSSIRDDEKATRSVGGIGEQLERIEQFSLGLMELGGPEREYHQKRSGGQPPPSPVEDRS